MNDGQRAHVEERLRDGASREEMVHYLQSEGVDEETAWRGVNEVSNSLARPAAGDALPSPVTLLSESWAFAKERLDLVGWYLLVSLAPLVLVVLPVGLAGLLTANTPALFPLVILVGLISVAAAVWLTVTAAAGIFYAVAHGDHTRFLAGWEWARPQFFSILVLGFIVSLMLFASFALLIIPGLILMVYIAFYFVEFVRHDRRGLHAPVASTHLVQGRFWAIAFRLAVMFLLILVINLCFSLVFATLGANAVVITLVGEVLSMLIGVFLTILFMRYLVVLHSAAVATAPAYQPVPHTQTYHLYQGLVWGAVGLLILLTGAVILLASW